jgi:hypothetical protein
VSGQSGGAQRRHHLVNIDLKPVVYRQVRSHTEVGLKKKNYCGDNSNVFGLQQEGVERGQSVWNLMELEQ